MVKLILKSLGITIVVSAIIAYFLTHFEVAFLKSFLLITAVQFVIWNISRHVIQSRLAIKQREQDNQMLAEFSKQSIIAPCAYCEQSNITPVRFDEDNKFECVSCKETNAVYVTVETAQVTTPLDLEKTTKVINEPRTK